MALYHLHSNRCLLRRSCTQNSCCCSTPQHPIVRPLNLVPAPPKTEDAPPPSQFKHQPGSSVLHKKERRGVRAGRGGHENPNRLPGERTASIKRKNMKQAVSIQIQGVVRMHVPKQPPSSRSSPSSTVNALSHHHCVIGRNCSFWANYKPVHKLGTRAVKT